MKATLELIKAKQNAIQAEADLKQAKENADREARIRTFAPLREMLKEVLELPAKSFGHIVKRPFVKDHLHCSYREGALTESVAFNVPSCSNYGLEIKAREDGTFDLYCGDSFKARDKGIPLERAQEELISHLALIVK